MTAPPRSPANLAEADRLARLGIALADGLTDADGFSDTQALCLIEMAASRIIARHMAPETWPAIVAAVSRNLAETITLMGRGQTPTGGTLQ